MSSVNNPVTDADTLDTLDSTAYAVVGGRATPQQINLGTASGASTGYISSTADATKGKYFLNAAGTMAVDEANARLGVGAINPGFKLHVAESITATSGTNSSQFAQSFVAPASAPGALTNYYAAWNQVVTSNTNFNANTQLVGANNNVTHATASTVGAAFGVLTAVITQSAVANITTAYGNWSQISNLGTGTIGGALAMRPVISNNSTGSITTAVAYDTAITNANASGTIGTTYGLRMLNPSNAGTMNTLYGVYIADLTAASTNYGIYFAGTGTSNGLHWGTTTNLYSPSANNLKTDDTFDANAYKVAGAAGADGSFTTTDGKTVTVTKGLITSIV